MTENVIQFPRVTAPATPESNLNGVVLQFPTAPGRYAVVTGSREGPEQIQSRHHSYDRAYADLMAIRNGKRPPKWNGWASLYDTAVVYGGDPLGAPILVNVFKKGRRGPLYDNRLICARTYWCGSGDTRPFDEWYEAHEEEAKVLFLPVLLGERAAELAV